MPFGFVYRRTVIIHLLGGLCLLCTACKSHTDRVDTRGFVQEDEALVFTAPGPVSLHQIEIVETERHPTLSDHRKELRTVDEANGVIARHPIYGDNGSGCTSSLFDTKETFTLIECNGRWMIIDKSSGQISLGPWHWNELPAGEYLVTYRRKPGDRRYERIQLNEISLGDLYQYKDPDF